MGLASPPSRKNHLASKNGWKQQARPQLADFFCLCQSQLYLAVCKAGPKQDKWKGKKQKLVPWLIWFLHFWNSTLFPTGSQVQKGKAKRSVDHSYFSTTARCWEQLAIKRGGHALNHEGEEYECYGSYKVGCPTSHTWPVKTKPTPSPSSRASNLILAYSWPSKTQNLNNTCPDAQVFPGVTFENPLVLSILASAVMHALTQRATNAITVFHWRLTLYGFIALHFIVEFIKQHLYCKKLMHTPIIQHTLILLVQSDDQFQLLLKMHSAYLPWKVFFRTSNKSICASLHKLFFCELV